MKISKKDLFCELGNVVTNNPTDLFGNRKSEFGLLKTSIIENQLDSLQQVSTKGNVLEIVPGITIEEVVALFYDSGSLRESPEQIFRLDRSGHRYYYIFDEERKPIFFPSNTTIISQTTPTSPFLIKWIADIGYSRSEEYKNERAAYGTFMHGEFARMIIGKFYDLDKLSSELDFYIQMNNLPIKFTDYGDELRKNMLSMAQFILDYNLEPIAVEIPLISRLGGFGSTIDLVCYITVSGERFPCIIDFKSGKSFYEENEIQLHACKMAWNENFETLQIERIFNWRPKDWRKVPTYEFKEQTKSLSATKLPHLLSIASIEDKKIDNNLIICSGIIDLTKNNLNENYKVDSLAELVKNRYAEKKSVSTKSIKDQSEIMKISEEVTATIIDKSIELIKEPDEVISAKIDNGITKNDLLDFNIDF